MILLFNTKLLLSRLAMKKPREIFKISSNQQDKVILDLLNKTQLLSVRLKFHKSTKFQLSKLYSLPKIKTK